MKNQLKGRKGRSVAPHPPSVPLGVERTKERKEVVWFKRCTDFHLKKQLVGSGLPVQNDMQPQTMEPNIINSKGKFIVELF